MAQPLWDKACKVQDTSSMKESLSWRDESLHTEAVVKMLFFPIKDNMRVALVKFLATAGEAKVS